MALALVIDRSGSMTETYREGHVLNAASAVFNNVTGGRYAGAELYLAFYDSRPSFVGKVTTLSQLQQAVAVHAPNGGGTQVSATLRGVIKQYRKKGIYIIVITDGEFADKVQVEGLVLNEIAPMLTADNPNAVRLHFIGAGEEVDKEFLRRLESEAAARGVTLVKQHHHAHLSHSHSSMLDEMDALYVGLGRDIRVEAPEGALLRAAQLQSAAGGTNQGQ
jgi:Mg-chelatase subunit ChlD